MILAWVLCAHSIHAQEFYELMRDPKVPLEKISEAARLYFEKNGSGKGSGYKAFRRWEYEQKIRRNSKGKALSSGEIISMLDEMHAKKSNLRVALPDQPAYTELGPRSNNLSQTSNGGVGMGRIKCITEDPQKNSTLYAAGVGGLWKSTDAGFSWNPLSDDLPYYAYSIAVHPTNSNLILAGLENGGVFKSLDGGKTWAKTGLPSTTPQKILFNPSNPNIVFVGATNGLYRSTDAGDTYTRLLTTNINDLDFKPTDLNVVYACGYDFFRSTDGGLSFSQVTSGVSTSDRSFLAVTAANPNYVYIVQANSSSLGYIYRSTNSGASFSTRLAANPANGTNYFGYDVFQAGGQAWYDMAITASPTNAEQILIGGIDVWGSVDGGASFSRVSVGGRDASLPFVHSDIHALEWNSNGNLYAGSDGGVYKSTDGGLQWSDLSNGIGNREFYRLGGIESDPYFIAAGAQDNGQSIMLKKGVHEWRNWSGADGMEAIVDYNNKNNVFGCHQNGGLTNSVDGGVTQLNNITMPTASGGAWVSPYFMDPVTPTTLYIGYTDLWKSTNSGLTWTKISNFGAMIEAATIAKSNNQYIYISSGTSIWITKNGGSTWQSIATAGLSGYINYISVHPSNENKVTVSTNAGIFKSDNAGTSWQNITYDLPDMGKRCVLYQNSPQDIIYVGLDAGVFYIKPSGTSWTEYSNGLPNVPVAEMEINYTIGMLRVATGGRGLWEVPIVTDGTTNVLPTVTITAPNNGASFMAPANITITANAFDADGTITKVSFYNGSTFLGTDLTAPYSLTISNVAAGGLNLNAQAFDNTGAVAVSKTVIVGVQNPVCIFNSSKLSGTVIGTAGSWDGISTKEKAHDGDINTYFDANVDIAWTGLNTTKSYRITGISYYPRQGLPDRMLNGRFEGSNVADFSSGVVVLATINTVPPQAWNCITITNTSSFQYVRYICNTGGVGNVAEIEFYGNEVVSPANVLPSISLTAPSNNASFASNANVNISANASDSDGSIAKVNFYDGSIFLGSDLSAPYSFTWSGMTLGAHTISAKAIDNNGGITTSTSIAVTITAANIAPGVSLSVPTFQTRHLRAPATVDLTASAYDVDGTVTKVEFYNGTTLIGTDLTAPFTFSASNISSGEQSFTAKATDNAGAVSTSIPIRIIIHEQICTYTDPKITSTVVIGTPGAWDGVSTRDNVFDNNINTYFDAPTDTAWSGLSLDKDYRVTGIKFYPREGATHRMTGGKFQGSNTANFSTGNVDLGVITAEPIMNWTCINVTNTGTFRYLRYICPAGGYGNVAEVEFYGVDASVNPAPTVSITSPANNATFTAPASITINATAADANGTVSNVQFYNGTTLLGSDATSPYSFTWTGVAVGTYSITAKATDNLGSVTTSTAVALTVVNAPPTVSITSPANNATFTVPASITINATAADANGTVSNVQFYNGTTLLGSDATSPYSFVWSNVAAGSYSITARATDNQGAVTTSTAVAVTVGTNPPPTVSITSPANNATFTAPANITITATAADANGTVSNVQFYNGTTLLGSDNTSPYSFVWSNVAAGSYSITARATDNLGAVTTSPAVLITSGNPPPTVTITSPANNATFTAPASITINATAADANGTVSNVQFYNGTTLLGSDATSPYTYTWTGVVAGTYSITARATDNLGAVTTSTAISVTVTSGGGNCVNKPIPDATKWVVRNNWNDQSSGSGVANTTEALQVTHRAWGQSHLWACESGTPYTVTSGKTYTISFDYKDHAGVALSSMQVAFASSVGTGGDPALKFPAVTVASGYSSSSYTTKSVNISATTGGTAYLSFKLNWAGQPNQTVVDLFKNISICEVSSARLDNEVQGNEDMIYPNPAKNEVTVRLSSEEQAGIELMDARGTILRSFKTSAKENTITLDGFSAGLYLIRVKEGHQEKVYRLIKE